MRAVFDDPYSTKVASSSSVFDGSLGLGIREQQIL